MKKIFLYSGALAFCCTTLFAQQPGSSPIIDNDILFDVTFEDNTVHDQSTFQLQGQQNGVFIGNGNANFYQAWDGNPSSSIQYAMPAHLNNDGDFTISLWYNGGSDSEADYELLFQKGDIKIALHDLNTPLVNNSIWDNSWNQNAYDFGTKSYNIGYSYKDKQQLVICKKSDSLYFYRNNKFKGKSKYVANPNSDKVVKIGDNFRGEIDRITIYNGVLSHQEIEKTFYFNPNNPIPNTCMNDLLFDAIDLIKGEGNVFYSCGYENDVFSDKNLLSFLNKTNYGSPGGTAYLTYPTGLVVIKEFYQSGQTFKLLEYGNYMLRFVKNDNCVIEKEFLFARSPQKPSINIIYPNTNVLCNNEGVWIDYYVGNSYVKKDINGFEINAVNRLTTLENPNEDTQFQTQQENDKILVNKPGTYKLTVDYGSCSVDYSSFTIDVLKCKDDVLGTNSETNSETLPQLIAYPNPTKTNLTLNTKVNGVFDIISALGKSFKIEIENGIAPIEHLPQGVYFLILNTKTLKVIKE